jgi:hypothetical protein
MEPQIKFRKIDIAHKSETKCLGMHVGKHMDWNAHIKSLSSKLNKACYMIKSLKHATSPLVIRSIYFVYFHIKTNSMVLVREHTIPTESSDSIVSE